MIHLVKKFINDFNYFPNNEEFEDYYFSHPDYPSLYAVTDTLEFFSIDNVAAKVAVDEFDNLPEKFITLYETENGDQFVYVTQNKNDTISFIDEDNKVHKKSKNDFLSKWKEIIIAIDENENPVQLIVTKNKNYFTSIIVIAMLLLLLNLWIIGFSIIAIIYCVLSLIGLGLSILIIQENLGISNEISSKICGVTATDKGSCQSVLSSKGATIYKNYTLSDACIVFFSTLMLLTIFSSLNNLYFIPISLFSIPIAAYSIYYQKVKVKKWCGLCMGILTVILGIIITTLVFNSSFKFNQILISTLYFVLTLSLILAVWIALKPFISGYFELKTSDRENKRFKRNINTFNSLLDATKKVNTQTLQMLPKIIIGNNEAITELSLFLSPSCGHCHKAFDDAQKLYQKHKETLKLAIYFNINIENENNPYKNVAEIIIEGYNNNGEKKALELLTEWHINKPTLEDFKQKNHLAISDKTNKDILSHFNWCTENDFNYSPVKLFNQKLMPNEYNLEDLNYFIKEYKV